MTLRPDVGRPRRRSAATARTGGYRRFAWTATDGAAARVVPRRGGRPRDWTSCRTATATCGRGAGGSRTPTGPASCWAATWTRCRTAARSTARSAWCRRSRRSTLLRARDVPLAPAARHRLLRRRGGRPVRRRLRRLAADHRRAGRRPGPRADRRRRHDHGRGDGRGRPRPGRARPGRGDARAGSATFVELHVEQGRGLVDRRRRSGSPRRSGRTGAGGSTSAARPTTPAPPGWPTARPDAGAAPPRCWRPARGRGGTARWRRSARCGCGRTA